MQLNQSQLEAVNYTAGPCLVIAGAGSGKTRVIITKIVHLIRSGQFKPSEIAAITFTNKAAAEMRERIAQELPQSVTEQICVSTFHSLGRMLLKDNARGLGYGGSFSIYDENDVFKILFHIIQTEHPDNAALLNRSKIQELQNKISMWKGRLKSPKELADEKDRLSVGLYDRYVQSMRTNNAVDFDDLIYLTTRLLKAYPALRERYAPRFRYLLVDEYQDTNVTQYEMMLCLVASHGRFTVVGDDDQSIYSWRGANPENIAQLSRDFPSLKVIKLEENYRSTPRILRCANALISRNPHLFAKTLRSGLKGADEGRKIRVVHFPHSDSMYRWVAASILGHQFDHRTDFSDYAVLYRSNSQARDMEKELLSARVPCKVVGDTGFFSRAEIKDMMAWCRLVANPHDNVALLRVINTPARGIGDKTLDALNKTAQYFKRSLFECMQSTEFLIQLSQAQHRSIEGFVFLLRDLSALARGGHDEELCDTLLERTEYRKYLESLGGSKESVDRRVENIRRLMGWIRDLLQNPSDPCGFGEAVERLGLREMLERNGDGDDTEGAVQLMTLHASKGLEFPYVYLIGMEEGILPHSESIKALDAEGKPIVKKKQRKTLSEVSLASGVKALTFTRESVRPAKDEEEFEENQAAVEEERRLAYVGITRARKELTMTVSHVRGSAQRKSVQRPSRFLNELSFNDVTVEHLDDASDNPPPCAESLQQSLSDLMEFAGLKGKRP